MTKTTNRGGRPRVYGPRKLIYLRLETTLLDRVRKIVESQDYGGSMTKFVESAIRNEIARVKA